jgi:hypothetical protein
MGVQYSKSLHICIQHQHYNVQWAQFKIRARFKSAYETLFAELHFYEVCTY